MGEWESKDGLQGWEGAGKHLPAQVAIHGFYIVILAACKGAQLVEGHSWSQREFKQLSPQS